MPSNKDKLVLTAEEETREVAAEELQRRLTQLSASAELVPKIYATMFDRQIAFVQDKSKLKVARCTRRAGKTQMWPRAICITALEKPGSLIRVWGPTRQRAKELVWGPLKKFVLDMEIPVEIPEESTLTLKFTNGSEVRMVGADKEKELHKRRGDKTDLEIILEAQNHDHTLKILVEDVIRPSLFDTDGSLCMEGTPGIVCAGYFYDVSGDNSEDRQWKSVKIPGWSCHHWSMIDNPKIDKWNGKKNWREIAISEHEYERIRRGWTVDHPTWIREWMGQWVNDHSALFYRVSNNNLFNDSVLPWGPGWTHSLGWDLGARDDMALVVWGFHPDTNCLYEAFSWKKPGASASEVMQQITLLEEKGFNIISRVADTGGGGRMYVDEVARRFGVHFEAAKKTEKYEHVRLMNDDLASGIVKVKEDSPLAFEMLNLPKDPNWPLPDKPEAPPREDPRFPNHCTDAGLYAYRAAYHYLHEPVKPRKVISVDEQINQELEELDAQFEREREEQRENIRNLYGA